MQGAGGRQGWVGVRLMRRVWERLAGAAAVSLAWLCGLAFYLACLEVHLRLFTPLLR